MNLLIIESPLQLLCAFEAIKSKPDTPYRLLLRENGRGSNDLHLRNCVGLLQLEYETFLLRPNKLKTDLVKNLPLLLNILSRKYNNIYLGSYYSSFLKTFQHSLRGKAIYYLDDGAATLRAQSDIQDGKTYKVNWFTFFNIQPKSSQLIVSHHFDKLRERFYKGGYLGSYFIGQPVEMMQGFTEEEYYKGVKLIADKFTPEDPLIYIPHRIENIDLIKQFENIRIKRLTLPIELYFLEESNAPCEIFGFYSTALYTLKKLIPEINSYFISTTMLSTTNVSLVYSYYRQTNLIEINL